MTRNKKKREESSGTQSGGQVVVLSFFSFLSLSASEYCLLGQNNSSMELSSSFVLLCESERRYFVLQEIVIHVIYYL